MIAYEHDGGLLWTICDFEGWWPVTMYYSASRDLYTRTLAEH